MRSHHLMVPVLLEVPTGREDERPAQASTMDLESFQGRSNAAGRCSTAIHMAPYLSSPSGGFVDLVDT